MPYQIRAAESVRKDLRRLPARDRQAVREGVADLSDDPRPRGAVKLVGSANAYRIRIGSYRVIYDVDDRARTITILRVRHRREAYRSL